MARSSTALFIVFMIFASFTSSLHGRKLQTEQENNNRVVPSFEDTYLYLSALPKGTLTPSPSKKGHVMIVEEKHFARHLAAIGRILSSGPSDGGVGHGP
ncbi:hypothetical protein RHSIM_Rhsim13G0187700 [Rhododendron simsii]|uniref:Uncharacterized protein n=1 Tax=Rhododendron simsii TaxID=118357 RepID=A0A834G0I0_RHOSS|nr:hypothetical protein RHSIM_Rhsim13G0187700 [Rhododendron simsii]